MKKSKVIALYAVTLALMIVLGGLPYVFLLPLLFISVTSDWKMSLGSGLMYGVISMVYAFIAPSSIVAVAFIEQPWIPIVPRIFVGVGAHFTFKAINRLIKGDSGVRRVVPYAVAGAVGSLLNTGLVIACLVLFVPTAVYGDIVMYAYAPYLLIAGAIELAVNTALLPPIVLTVGRALKHGEKKRVEPAPTETNENQPSKENEQL